MISLFCFLSLSSLLCAADPPMDKPLPKPVPKPSIPKPIMNNDDSPPPNLVFILMDDLGWADISVNGGQFPTPNIDNLFTSSVSLERHYIHLMCSPSRSQIITGRYAMYQGFGKMLPWDYTEIGGIPMGQPTIAAWLKEMGDYKTYAVGKWHMGYAADDLLPTNRGFDHFYGFYQGAIHYDSMKYIDIKFGESEHYDFWEDGQECNELIDEGNGLNPQLTTDDNTMYLYRDKIVEYLNDMDDDEPFYMFLPLQTIHGPLNEVASKMDECNNNILPSDAVERRQKYCQNMLLTDDIIGDIINGLKDTNNWDNTLLVFTSDNGGDISNDGCNYPLRGTKGTLFDGNLRTVAMIGGGILPIEQRGTTRSVLFSSLDWTPTLLHYAQILNKIEKPQITWDGIDQYDLIMSGEVNQYDDNVIENENRDHIVMNIGLKSLESASIVFKYDEKLFKYISEDESIDQWAYKRDDGWCIPDENGDFNLILNDDISMAQPVDNKYLFDLTNDLSEKNNLLQYGADDPDNLEIIGYAKDILNEYTKHPLFSENLHFLWNRLPAGDPDEIGEAFIAPFLTNDMYITHLQQGFDDIDVIYDGIDDLDEYDMAVPYTKALKGLYFTPWRAPNSIYDPNDHQIEESSSSPPHNKSQYNIYIYLIIGVGIVIFIVVVTCLWILFKNHFKSLCYNNEYQSIKDDDRNYNNDQLMDDHTPLIIVE